MRIGGFNPKMALEKRHIMVVDDDPNVLESLVYFLSKKGYRVSYASGGERALKLIEEDPPDLVLLDELMPGMDGMETLQGIEKRFPNVEVVMISALQNEGVARATLKMGAYEWIPKPFTLYQLEAAVILALLRRDSKMDDKNQDDTIKEK